MSRNVVKEKTLKEKPEMGESINIGLKWDFRNLEIWKLGRKIRLEVESLVKACPSEEKYRLADQLIRAGRSVTANIAEGHGRYHYQENIQFCRQARGSVFELLDHLIVAIDNDYIQKEHFQDWKVMLQKRLD